jgi:hypothetical protein
LFCEKPERTIQRAIALLRNQARKFLGLTPVDRKPFSENTGSRKYQKPSMRQITPEQAILVLIGHATVGDQGAKELMEVVFLPCHAQRLGNAPVEAAFTPPQLYGHSLTPDCP